MDYQQKYLKYKNKYLTLKAQMGGKVPLYIQNFKLETLNNCNVQGSNSKSGFGHCNCPGFLHINTTVPDDTLCFLCKHKKKDHVKNDLSFDIKTGSEFALCNSK
jgi:hypothetical protein